MYNSEQLSHFLSGRDDEDEIRRLIFRSQVQCEINQGEIVGLALTWESSIHPYCTYLKIVTIKQPPEDTEHKLISKIKSDKPLQSLVQSTNQRINSFFIENEFKMIRRTYFAQLKTKRLHEECNDIFPISQIGNQKRDLIFKVKHNYESTHRANPVADLSIEQWERLIFADDLINEGSFVALDPKSRDIIAYSFLHQSEEDGLLELGWCGGDPDALEKIISMQAHIAKEKGIEFLEGEFDTTDHAAMSVFNTFPFQVQETYFTYREK